MMQRRNLLELAFLIFLSFLLYYPIFSAEYLYTDESVQLWLYKKGSSFQMFTYQGRYITDRLFSFLFSKADIVQDVTFIRIFSFCGWLVSIPVWYFVLKSVSKREGMPEWLSFASVVFLICSPTFSISVGWASCLELFLANTTGLLSGFIIYSGIKLENNRLSLSFTTILIATILGVVSLFTYQNGYGCFLIPFLMNLLAKPGQWKKLIIGLAGFLFIAIVYYGLFKYQIKMAGAVQLDRTVPHINPLKKLEFFFTKPLTSAFHLNYLVTETSSVGVLISMIVFLISIGLYWMRIKVLRLGERIKQLLLLILLLFLSYLPSLIVKENYASNRTTLALAIMSFIFLLFVFINSIRPIKWRTLAVTGMISILIANAYYNFNYQFLNPVLNEYKTMRVAVMEQYKPGIDSFVVHQPSEEMFVKKYGVARSWDEFGVPSLFFNWVPEFFIKQMVFEKTKDRSLSDKLIIKNWSNNAPLPDSLKSGNIVYINAAQY